MVLKLAFLTVLALAAVRAQTFDACHEANHEVMEGEEWRWRHNRMDPDHDKPRCDTFKAPTWRRFKADSGEDLVNKCPPKHSCGTRHPIWMNGTIPEESEGEVMRKACLHKDDKCCAEVLTISVKNCGDFRVYKLSIMPQKPDCDMAYCVGDKKPCDDDDDDDKSSEEHGEKHGSGEHRGRKHRKHGRHHKGGSSSEEGSSEEKGEGKCHKRHKKWRFMKIAVAVGAGGLIISTIVLVSICCVACCRRRRARTTLTPRAPQQLVPDYLQKKPLDTAHMVSVDMKRPLFDSLEHTYPTAEQQGEKGQQAEKYQVA